MDCSICYDNGEYEVKKISPCNCQACVMCIRKWSLEQMSTGKTINNLNCVVCSKIMNTPSLKILGKDYKKSLLLKIKRRINNDRLTNDPLTQDFLDLYCQACPSCGYMYLKEANDGCDVMTCLNCRKGFVWNKKEYRPPNPVEKMFLKTLFATLVLCLYFILVGEIMIIISNQFVVQYDYIENKNVITITF